MTVDTQFLPWLALGAGLILAIVVELLLHSITKRRGIDIYSMVPDKPAIGFNAILHFWPIAHSLIICICLVIPWMALVAAYQMGLIEG